MNDTIDIDIFINDNDISDIDTFIYDNNTIFVSFTTYMSIIAINIKKTPPHISLCIGVEGSITLKKTIF